MKAGFIEALGVFLGAGLGGLVRWLCTLAIQPPLGILAVNTLGSLLMGVAMVRIGEGWRAFVLAGLLGGFTTMSAYSADVIRMVQERQFAPAVFYVVGTQVLCLGGAWAGYSFASR